MGVGPRRSTERIEENVELAGRIAGQFGNVLMGSFDSLTQTLLDLLRSLSSGLKQRDGSGEGWGHRFEQIGDYSAACAPLEFSKALDDRMRLGLEGDLYAWFEGGHVCSQVDTSSRSVSAGGHFVKRWTLGALRLPAMPWHATGHPLRGRANHAPCHGSISQQTGCLQPIARGRWDNATARRD